MSQIEGVVYDPPTSDYPALVVFFRPNGDVLATYAAQSKDAAQSMLVRVLEEVQTKLDQEGLDAEAEAKTREKIVSTCLQ